VEERDGWVHRPARTRLLGFRQASRIRIREFGTSRRHDRIEVKPLGTAPAGFPIEQTIKRTEQGKSTLKVGLLEFSQAPLNDALFQVPQHDSPALGAGHGGYDMTRPGTLANRPQMYWVELKILATQ
jgi:hypothetical protein